MSIFIKMKESEAVIVLKYFLSETIHAKKMGAEELILPNS